SGLLEKEQYAAHIIRPRLERRLPDFLKAPGNPKAKLAWKKPPKLLSLEPDVDLTQCWTIDRSVRPVMGFKGGSAEAHRLLNDFISKKLEGYGKRRNHPEVDATSRLSPYLHFG